MKEEEEQEIMYGDYDNAEGPQGPIMILTNKLQAALDNYRGMVSNQHVHILRLPPTFNIWTYC